MLIGPKPQLQALEGPNQQAQKKRGSSVDDDCSSMEERTSVRPTM